MSNRIINDKIYDENILSNQINSSIGQRSPIIKAKLDATNPSILNLSSEMSNRSKSNIFENNNIGNLNITKEYHPPNKISLFTNNLPFIPGHFKAFSNEVFSNPRIFNIIGGTQENDKSFDESENEDIFPYNYGGEINFEGGSINFWSGDPIEKNDDKVYIEDKINEEDKDGFNILEMLKKIKNQK